jgi:hypothetical protein
VGVGHRGEVCAARRGPDLGPAHALEVKKQDAAVSQDVWAELRDAAIPVRGDAGMSECRGKRDA